MPRREDQRVARPHSWPPAAGASWLEQEPPSGKPTIKTAWQNCGAIAHPPIGVGKAAVQSSRPIEQRKRTADAPTPSVGETRTACNAHVEAPCACCDRSKVCGGIPSLNRRGSTGAAIHSRRAFNTQQWRREFFAVRSCRPGTRPCIAPLLLGTTPKGNSDGRRHEQLV
jgi:hypothetical protein